VTDRKRKKPAADLESELDWSTVICEVELCLDEPVFECERCADEGCRECIQELH
jgi:hypothetical protein